MKRPKPLLIAFLALCVTLSFASAHSGGTDFNGGHKDNKNKSGLGSYHYHHGYGPHLHTGGVCPYDAPKPAPSPSPSKAPAPKQPTPTVPVPAPVAPTLPPEIKITLNGEPIVLTDTKGNRVKPVVIDGTTYLPVRGLADSLGLTAEWDSATNTIALTDKTNP